jgi:predicted metalloprotease with PDZ domain
MDYMRSSIRYEYQLDMPAGTSMLHAHMDCVYSKASRTAAALEWEDLMLHPAHMPVHNIAIQPTVTVPAGWGIGTSLKPVSPYDAQHPAGGKVQFEATTVEMLEDSPVMTGLYFHEYTLLRNCPEALHGLDRTHRLFR